MSPKNYLQEIQQKAKKLPPTYNSKQDGLNSFVSTVMYMGTLYTGKGTSKKNAEANAAKNVLITALGMKLD